MQRAEAAHVQSFAGIGQPLLEGPGVGQETLSLMVVRRVDFREGRPLFL
jgi:hypothetical protein